MKAGNRSVINSKSEVNLYNLWRHEAPTPRGPKPHWKDKPSQACGNPQPDPSNESQGKKRGKISSVYPPNNPLVTRYPSLIAGETQKHANPIYLTHNNNNNTLMLIRNLERRRSVWSWLSIFYSKTAPSPTRIGRMYFYTSIVISRRDIQGPITLILKFPMSNHFVFHHKTTCQKV